MYTQTNFKTKKAVKAAVSAYLAGTGQPVLCYNPGPIGECPKNGTIPLEGPHYPQPHSWYAQGVLKDGILIKVK